MARIPVVTSFGGINAAGRSSGHHGYRRMVIDALDAPTADETWRSLAALMNIECPLTEETRRFIADHTLIRAIEPQYVDRAHVPWNRKVTLRPAHGAIRFNLSPRDVPQHVPDGWGIETLDADTVQVTVESECDVFVRDTRALDACAAGQLPTGFDPQALYAARSHPRGLQMTVYAASDALGNLGLSWDTVADKIAADHISVYAGSAMSQLDANSNGGLMASRYQGKRVTSKHVAMGLAEMPADFVNAYVLGNVGTTGHNMGACATFLYNLRQGVHDIRAGRARVALIGGAEAPLVPEVIDGLTTMGALGTDQALLQLDKHKGLSIPDYRRACRPFAENCGFTVAEGAQFVMLMDDELALELGADIHAVIADVYVNADGHKKSITSPGVGNYVTFAKAVKLAEQILGTQAVRQRSFVHAHGTGTPQNRVTESRILNETAKVFGIQDWPVAAIKCYLGHTMSVASGDQLVNALGTWRYGIIPGIATIDSIADDVHASQLRLSPEHLQRRVDELDIAFLNAKGFGGNNATATVLAPHIAEQVLVHKHGTKKMDQWREHAQQTRQQVLAYDRAATAGETLPIYRFDDEVRGDEHVHLTPAELRIDGYAHPISLEVEPPFRVPW